MFASLPTSWVAIVMATSALAAPYAKTDFSVDQNVTDFDLIARATGPNSGYNCGGRWASIGDGTWKAYDAAYPSIVDKTPQICTGPHTCIQIPEGVRCYNSGSGFLQVGMCNDNNYGKCVDAPDVRTRLRELARLCYRPDYSGNAAGQAFYPDGTNVIIRQCPGTV